MEYHATNEQAIIWQTHPDAARALREFALSSL
jgi:hypothetical protein